MTVPMRGDRLLKRWYLGARSLAASVILAELMMFMPAASAMDCGKATGTIETAICANSALKAQDARLGRLYFSTLKKLSGRRHDTLIEDQRLWLAERFACASSPEERSACLDRLMVARTVQITACYADAAPNSTADVSCPVAAYASCPRSRVSASARVWSYPFLVAKLEAEADRDRKDEENLYRCAPQREDNPRSLVANTSDYSMTIAGAGEGWVTVRTVYDADFRDAVHPFHVSAAATYEVPSGKVFSLTKLLPRLATDKGAADLFWNAAKTAACRKCGGEDTPSLSEIAGAVRALVAPDGPGPPLPDAWSIQADGGLRVYYPYYMYGRFYVAVSVVERSVFIAWVDPRYARLFTRP